MSDVIFPFAGLALIIFFALLWYIREGRNPALECQLRQNEFGSPHDFDGTLAVEEHRPGSYIRFCKSTKAARNMQFTYRWLIGIGPQAAYDEVSFDRSQRVVELKRKNCKAFGFADFQAIRMREVAGGRGGGSLWHVELVPQKGTSPIPFVTSRRGDRRAMFENAVPVAKAVSAIMDIPVQVFVAGNVWTPGWPPKALIDSRSR